METGTGLCHNFACFGELRVVNTGWSTSIYFVERLMIMF